MADFIQANDVAELIGLPDGAAFLRRRDTLERDHGFPPPMPTSARPLIWRRARVAAWVEAQGRPEPQHPAHLPANVHLLQQAARR